MNGILLDSCILLDVFTNDPRWADWSEKNLSRLSQTNTLYINSIVYTEISIGFKKIEELENVLEQLGIRVLEIPREALFLAGKIFQKYRQNKGTKSSTLPDFFIGAHATISSFGLITRDTSRFKTYFPKLLTISPDNC